LVTFFQQLINGLDLGSIYALIALGYTMVYGIVKLINFAHGEVLMVGSYIGYFVLLSLDPNPLPNVVEVTIFSAAIAILLAMIGSAALGMSIDRLAYRPLRKKPRINALITAIGVSLLLMNLGQVLPFVGPTFKNYPTPSFTERTRPLEIPPSQELEALESPMAESQEQILPPPSKLDDQEENQPSVSSGRSLSISGLQIMVFSITVVMMLALWIFVEHTKTGRAMRAAAYDQTAAALMGINVNRTISITFAIGSALAGLAGVLYAMKYPSITPDMGLMPGLKAFVAAVLGGIGNIPGAVLGGLLIGVFETMVNGYISSQWSEVIVFSLLIIVLMIRPSGLLGKEKGEKI